MDDRIPDILDVNGKEYRIIRLLGKGKGGYSYLAENSGREYVLKQIHHEPCSYYQFGDKMQAELNDYKKLKKIGIPVPELLDADVENERLVKEYIEGETVYELVKKGKMEPGYISQMREMCGLLYAADTNIDYFPTNFIAGKDKLYYIDYECNAYMEEWNFENWGIKYWSRSEEFLAYVREHDARG